MAGDLKFESRQQSVTLKPDQVKMEILFPFTNAGEDDVVIKRYDAPCTCMSAQLKGGHRQGDGSILFKSGEKGVIKGLFELGNLKGTIDKQIVIWTNGDAEDTPSIVLTTQITIPELIKASPAALSWELGGEAKTQEMIITVSGEKPIQITKHECSNPAIAYVVETRRPGFEYCVKITPKTTNEILFASLRFTTNSDNPRFQLLQTFLTIKPAKK